VVKIINFLRFFWKLWCQGLSWKGRRSTFIPSLRLKSIITFNKCPSLVIVFIFHHWELFFVLSQSSCLEAFWEGWRIKKRGKKVASTAILCCTIINIHITYLFSLSLMCCSVSLTLCLTHSIVFSFTPTHPALCIYF